MWRLPLLTLLVGFSFVLSALAEELPADEEALYRYALANLNHRTWRDAERALDTYIERFPKGKHVEEATFKLGQLHASYSRRYTVAREVLGGFCGRYPKSQWYWSARFLIGQTYQNQNLKERAIEVYRAIAKECPEANFRTSAAHTVFRLQDKHLNPYVNQSFTVGQEPFVQISSHNVPAVDIKLWAIPFGELVERLGPGRMSVQDAVAKVPADRRELVHEWREVLWKAAGRWHNKRVALPAKEAGLYVAEIGHDDVVFTVTVVVNRYGLIVKQGAGQLLVFAQDRTTGAPVADLLLRVFAGEKKHEGRTNAEGVYLGDAVAGKAQVIGIKDGEVILGQSWWSGMPLRTSRFYVFTDRPIYRPEQDVRFKIVHRVEEAGRLETQDSLKVKVTIQDPRGNKVYEKDHELNEFGSTFGEFRLGEEPSLGQYTVRVQSLSDTAPLQRWWGEFADTGRFRVDEYRKPEFKVDVSFDRSRYIQGDTLQATIAADYYFGSPVPDAQVVWQVYQRPHWWYWGARAFWCEWYLDGEGEWYGGRGQVVHQGQGKTDEKGRLRVSWKIPREGSDQYYTVVAQVTDLSRRRIDGAGGVVATQAEFGLQVALDRYVAQPDAPFDVKIAAKTHEGKPVRNQAVRLTILHRKWGGEKYREREVYRAEELTTDGDGLVTARVKIPDAGYMRILAEATDARGNTVKTERYLWIVSPEWSGGTMRWQGVDIVPDKDVYEPGETATLLLTSQEKDLHLLFTLEGDRLWDHRVVKMNGHTATVRVKLEDRYAPNVYATVMALHQGSLYQKTKSLQVDPSDRFLTIEIRPQKKQYRPREKASFEILTRDQHGNPVSAELAVSAVDESIYALQPELAADMRKFFVRKKWNRIASSSSLQFWARGRAGLREGEEAATDAEAPMEAKAPRREALKGLTAESYAVTEIRSEFADTLLWQPAVVTGADGRATVTVDRLADDLTTWRVTARGMSRSGLVGQEKESILVRKDVIVRLQTPRFFTQGDHSFVTAVVRNDLATKKAVKVVLEAEGVEIGGALERIVEIGPQGEARVDWTAFVGAPGTAKLTVKSLTDEASDAMRLEVPVLPHGTVMWAAKAGLVEGTATETLRLPDGALRDASELLVVVSPSHAATVLDALDYLAGYPYGCVEQTMSRFLPTAITRQVLQRLDIRKPELEKELPRMLRAGLRRLYDFQHSDGGWGWWRNDQSNPFITAYVVYGLSLAQRADVRIDQNVLKRAIQALRRQIETAEDDETRAYLLYALSTAGEKVPGARDALADAAHKLPAATQAMLALVLHQDGETDEAKRVLALLKGNAQEAGAGVYWQGKHTYKWTGHNVETTALALKALLAVEPGCELTKRVVVWLSLQREGRHWVSTRQTAMVVYALADYLALTGEREPDMKLTVTVNGETVLEQRVTKQNWYSFDGTIKLDGSRLATGDNEIRITREGTGTPVYAAYLRAFQKADTFEPSTGGLTVERTYHRVTTEKGKPKLVPLEDGADLKSGDEIQVTLKIKADRPYRYLMMEDPLPAGCEPVREPQHRWYGRHWNFWFANKEFRDEKVDIAVTYLPEGERTVTYRMRAETPGNFRILPALVWNMYRPGEGANSSGYRFKITD